MGRNPLELVREFHEVMNLGINSEPRLPDAELRGLRSDLMLEEISEYIRAESQDDIINIAEELADLVYVAYGTALEYGIPLDKIIEEKHRSNMSKLGDDGKPIRRDDGKILKGPNFSPPNTKEILENE